MARLILSLVMLLARAFESANFKRILPVGSAPPIFTAIVISRLILVVIAPRIASFAPFLRLMFAHFECPDINCPLSNKFYIKERQPHFCAA